jgi:hypothetical protein
MRSLREREGDMADDKLREAALKPIATIKKPVIAAEKKEEAKTVDAAEAKKEEAKAAKKPAAKKTAAKKTTVKKATPAKAAEKKEDKPAAKKAPVKKATATKAAAKKTETKKAEAKPAAKKPAAKKAPAKKATTTKAAATKTNIVLQFADKSVTYDTFVENAKNVWQYDMGRKVSEIKTLELYVKPEDGKVYFVVNGEVHAEFNL